MVSGSLASVFWYCESYSTGVVFAPRLLGGRSQARLPRRSTNTRGMGDVMGTLPPPLVNAITRRHSRHKTPRQKQCTGMHGADCVVINRIAAEPLQEPEKAGWCQRGVGAVVF